MSELIMHALGWPKCYRNYFAACPDSEDAREWDELVSSGYAVRGKVINEPPHDLQLYHVTDSGRALLSEKRNES